MSRCFPYPPPGYTLSRASEEALIESIKLQKEREKAKEQRKKEKRREKNEKRREKKEKSKEKKEKRKEKKEKNVETNQKSVEYEIPKGSIGKSILANSEQLDKSNLIEETNQPNVETNQKSAEYEIPKGSIGKSISANSEQLEKSNLTEETKQPICLLLPSSSSDSTETSSKRKRQSSPTDGNHGYCNIIRIRLPSKIQNESDASINEQQLCSTSGRTDILPLNKDEIDPGSRQENFCCQSEETINFGQGEALKTDKKSVCLTSVKIDAISPGKTGTPSVPDVVTTPIQRQELLYKNLINKWIPQPQQDTSFDSDDLSWLFPGKNQGSPTKKRQKSENDGMPCPSPWSLCPPRAQYLPQVDVYELPYVVPY